MGMERELAIDRMIPFYTKAMNPERTVKLVFLSGMPKEKIMLRLAEALNLLGGLIVYMNIQREEKTGEFLWIIIIEFKVPKDEFQKLLDNLLKSMKENGEVSKYYYVFPLDNGYFVDHNIFSLKDPRGRRVAIFSHENLVGLFVITRNEYGLSTGGMIIRKIGEMFGRAMARELKKECLSLGIRGCLEILHAQGEVKGFLHQRSIEMVRDREGVVLRIELNRLIEEEILLEHGIKECGTHQKGVYLGFLSELLGKELNDEDVIETKCISKGDPVSIFVIKLPHEVLV